MADSSVTLYPGDTLTVTCSAGQEPEPGNGDQSGAEPTTITNGSTEPAASTPTEQLPPGTAPDEPVVDVGPAAGTVPSPVDLG